MSAGADAPVITIDGPSGSGKGTIARLVAEALGWHLLDSGALYRLAGLAARRAGADFDDAEQLTAAAATMQAGFETREDGSESILLDDDDVTQAIRTEQGARDASLVAACEPVRAALIGAQRECRRRPGLVADGRDMGTVVFPDAPLKIFLTASVEERASRRHKQLKEQGIDVSLSRLSADIAERDRRDRERDVAPLRPSKEAVVVDSTSVSIKEVVAQVLDAARDRNLISGV